MEITDSFRVATPLATTWNILLDIERIAPCMPGAQLQEIEGNEFRGIVKVKVGPISAQYKGAARLANVDEATRTITIDASGRDTRGQGNASATITVKMAEAGGGTQVDIATELSITGKVAQFGRGVMADVSTKILKQFVDNLERDVLSAPVEELAAVPHVAAEPAAGPRTVEMRETEAVNLLDTAGAPVLKRALPALGALLLVLLFWRRRRKRAR